MTTGAGTLTIQETLLGARALPPPPTRHALFAILIALAALLHLGTIGIGDLYSETEGQYAAAAREMIQPGQYLLPTNDSIPRLQKPPLLYWLIIASYKLFGVHTAATRVPIALSVMATAMFTFLIGERLADYWRGFAAGLVEQAHFDAFRQRRVHGKPRAGLVRERAQPKRFLRLVHARRIGSSRQMSSL